jgi:hypothetical protein
MEHCELNVKKIIDRLNKIEEKFNVKENFFNVIMWQGEEGGIFGHAHITISDKQTVFKACSDEKELQIMRQRYEESGHKLPLSVCKDKVSFREYLEYYSYLGPEKLEQKRRKII